MKKIWKDPETPGLGKQEVGTWPAVTVVGPRLKFICEVHMKFTCQPLAHQAAAVLGVGSLQVQLARERQPSAGAVPRHCDQCSDRKIATGRETHPQQNST